jgi:hypothetical protein
MPQLTLGIKILPNLKKYKIQNILTRKNQVTDKEKKLFQVIFCLSLLALISVFVSLHVLAFLFFFLLYSLPLLISCVPKKNLVKSLNGLNFDVFFIYSIHELLVTFH